MSAKHLPPAAGLLGVRIQVTAKDIAEGVQGLCFGCPVARAINRHLAKGFFSKVGRTDVLFCAGMPLDKAFRIVDGVSLPTVAREWIERFDRNAKEQVVEVFEPSKPFGFYLPLPVSVLKASTGVKS